MKTLFDDDTEPAEPEPDPAIPILAFTVMGRPQQRGSKVSLVPTDRQGNPFRKNGRIIVSTKDSNEQPSRAWMACVQSAAKDAFGLNRPLLSVPLQIGAKFYFARPKGHYSQHTGSVLKSAPKVHAQSPDLDKLMRCLLDALTGQVYLDDKQICRFTADTGRYWTESQERAEVVLFVVGQ